MKNSSSSSSPNLMPEQQQELNLLLLTAAQNFAGEVFYQGKTSTIADLIAQGAEVNFRDGEGCTILMNAAKNGCIKNVQTLIDNGAEIDARDQYGCNALMMVTEMSNPQILYSLAERGVNIFTPNHDYLTQTNIALNNHAKMVQTLIKNGSDVNATSNTGWTSLMWASMNNGTEIIDCLLSNGANPNIANHNGITALIMAVEWGHLKATQTLIKHGAEINFTNKYGDTALLTASKKGHTKIAHTLIDNDADINAAEIFYGTVLMTTATFGHAEIAQALIENGVNADATDHNGKKALDHSINALDKGKTTNAIIISSALNQQANSSNWQSVQTQLGNEEIRDLLTPKTSEFLAAILPEGNLQKTLAANLFSVPSLRKLKQDLARIGFTPDQQNKTIAATLEIDPSRNGSTYLAALLPEGKLKNEIVQKFNLKNPKEPLNTEEIVELRELVKKPVTDFQNAGNAIAQKQKLNSLLLEAAESSDGKVASRGQNHTITDLLDQGADVNFKDKNGCTALMNATKNGLKENVQTLIQNGANLNSQNLEGFTALMHATKYGHLEIMKNLIESGADAKITNNVANSVFLFALHNGSKVTNAVILDIALNQCHNSSDWELLQKKLSTSEPQKLLTPATSKFLAATLPAGNLQITEMAKFGDDAKKEVRTLIELKQNLAAAGLTENQQNRAVAFEAQADRSHNNSIYLAAILPEGDLQKKIIQNQPLDAEKINALRCFAYGITEMENGKEIKLDGFTKNIPDQNGWEKKVIDYQSAGEVIWKLTTNHKTFERLTIATATLIDNEILENVTTGQAAALTLSNSYLAEKINPYLAEKAVLGSQGVLEHFKSYMKNHAKQQDSFPKNKPEFPQVTSLKEESKSQEL